MRRGFLIGRAVRNKLSLVMGPYFLRLCRDEAPTRAEVKIAVRPTVGSDKLRAEIWSHDQTLFSGQPPPQHDRPPNRDKGPLS